MNVGIACTFTLRDFPKHLENYCQEKGIDAKFHLETSYNLCSELLTPATKLHESDVLFIFIDTESLIPEYLDLAKMSPEQREKLRLEKLTYLKSLITASQASTIIFHNLEVPNYSPLGIIDHKDAGLRNFVKDINRDLEVREKNVYVFDYDAFLAWHGKKNSKDSRFYYLADMKLSSDLLPHLAKEYASYLTSLSGRVRKCIVLDLDNTLWGGVVGEVGMSGIKLGPEPPGNAFLDFQKHLLALFHKGIILTINSKNNPKDALEVIRHHPFMLLREEHFSAMRINWQDKASNIQEIANELNISPNSMVFFDDDKHNRLLINSVLPEVLTVNLPPDPSYYTEILRDLNVFNTTQLTNEDKVRGKMYADERGRRELEANSSNFETFLRELNMVVTLGKGDEFTIPRLSQMTQRTNQFNLTTRRYAESDIKQFIDGQDTVVRYIHSKDRLGDTGIVGLAIGIKKQDALLIDTFLMSCRVIGRRIEEVLLDELVSVAKKMGVSTVVGEYIPSKKNAQTQDFYKDHGFKLIGDLWEISVEDYQSYVPEFVEVKWKKN